VRSRGQVEPVFVEKVEELAASLKDVIRDKDVIVTMGAGNISAVSHGLPARLKSLVTGARPERRRSR
jgi:UDP-N-acetylmuramate--alanine ligase